MIEPIPSREAVVVMPVAHRPEMLALALERLAGIPWVPEVMVYLDHIPGHPTLRDTEWVIDTFCPSANLRVQPAHPVVVSGCWNILQSIAGGSRLARNVFLVEEDVMCYPSFFEWHSSVWGCSASCGRWTAYNDLRGPVYTNPGSCLRGELLDALVPHITANYFADPGKYCTEHFPYRPEWSVLDDGLIRRVCEQIGPVAFPPKDKPVCAHQGWTLYNKIDIYMNHETEIEAKIARLRELMAGLRVGDRYVREFEPYNP